MIEQTKLQNELSNLQEDAESKMKYLQKAQERKLEKEREAHRSALEKANIELRTLLNQLKHRQSNPEDVENIESLNLSVTDLQAELATAKEEMNFFRRELINREENFNRKFTSKSPRNVGVMNVLKPKTTNGETVNIDRRRSSVRAANRNKASLTGVK